MASAEKQDPLLETGACSAPLLPQFIGIFTWDGYDEEEATLGRRLRRIDYLGIIVIAIIYTALALLFAPSLDGVHLGQKVPTWVLGLQGLCFVVTLYVCYLDAACPSPLKQSPEVYGALSGPFSRYIFLTRQTMALQFVHAGVTLISHLTRFTPLVLGSDVLSPVVGGAGVFVTIQFFLLVFPDDNFRADCQVWLPRGYALKIVASALHTPQLLLAVVDICVLRCRPVLLEVMPKLIWIVVSFFVYAIAYVGLLHWNHARTGQWPYGILEPLGNSVMKWTQFTAVQSCILAVFGACLWGLAQVAPVFW